jgi:hypothetical protein
MPTQGCVACDPVKTAKPRVPRKLKARLDYLSVLIRLAYIHQLMTTRIAIEIIKKLGNHHRYRSDRKTGTSAQISSPKGGQRDGCKLK